MNINLTGVRTAVILGSLGLIFLGCARVSEEASREALEAAISSFYFAVEENNLDGRLALFTDDAIMMPNHWTIIRGKGDIGDVIRSGGETVFQIKDLDRLELALSGDIGYTVNSYCYGFVREGQETEWHKTKNVHIWRRQPDGSWKLHVDIWNSDVPVER